MGPSFEHYRCVKIYVPETGAVHDADTVQFFPENIQLPETSTEDYLKQASNDILSILRNPPSSLPYLQAGSETKNAIAKIAQLLNRSSNSPPPLPITDATPPRVESVKNSNKEAPTQLDSLSENNVQLPRVQENSKNISTTASSTATKVMIPQKILPNMSKKLLSTFSANRKNNSTI